VLKTARKTKLSEDKLPYIAECIELGMSYAATAGAIGVTAESWNNWMNWGKAGIKDPIFSRFYATVREAESKLMFNCLTKLKQVNDTAMNPQSIQWLLERRFPESFGKRNALEVNSKSESLNLNVNANINKDDQRMLIVGMMEKLTPKNRLLNSQE
jgi:transposase-like protein